MHSDNATPRVAGSNSASANDAQANDAQVNDVEVNDAQVNDAQVDVGALEAEVTAFTALFDATALAPSEDALTRLATFADGLTPPSQAPPSTVGVRDAQDASRRPADVWPIRSLLALAAALLLTMGGLTWGGGHDAAAGRGADAGSSVYGVDMTAAQPANVARASPLDPRVATAALSQDDPLMGVGQDDWMVESGEQAAFDLGGITLYGSDEDEYSDYAD